MTREEIKNIVNKYFRKLKKQYKSIDPEFDVEAIHDFRVVYKKLRAFFRLIPDGKAEEVKVPGKLKKLYRALGAIRDMQLQRQRIKNAVKQKPGKPQAYLAKLNREIRKQKEELLERFSNSIIADAEKKTALRLPSKLNKNNIRNFTQEKQSNNQQIIASGDFSDDNLHSIRKNLKDIYYVQEISNESENGRLPQNKKKSKDEDPAKQFLDKMGDFQDKRTGISLINSSWLMQITKNEQELLIQIKQGWIKDKVNMKRTLVSKLKSPSFQIT